MKITFGGHTLDVDPNHLGKSGFVSIDGTIHLVRQGVVLLSYKLEEAKEMRRQLDWLINDAETKGKCLVCSAPTFENFCCAQCEVAYEEKTNAQT